MSADLNALKGIAFLPLEKLLDLVPYRRYLLCGLIPSMGKLDLKMIGLFLILGSVLPWTAKHSQDILVNHLKPIKYNIQVLNRIMFEL